MYTIAILRSCLGNLNMVDCASILYLLGNMGSFVFQCPTYFNYFQKLGNYTQYSLAHCQMDHPKAFENVF